MEYQARVVLGGWGEDPDYDRARVDILLEALTQIAELGYRRANQRGERLPSVLHSAQYIYRPAERGADDWADLQATIRRGWGACVNLGTARAGELRAHGLRASPFVVEVDGENWHVMVARADGRTEDPSAAVGMET